MIGGGLLLNSIRSMFGDHAGLGGHERSAFGSSSSTASDNLTQKDRDQDQDQDQDDRRSGDQDNQDQDQDQDDDGGDFGGTIPTTREISCALPLSLAE